MAGCLRVLVNGHAEAVDQTAQWSESRARVRSLEAAGASPAWLISVGTPGGTSLEANEREDGAHRAGSDFVCIPFTCIGYGATLAN